MATYLEVIDFDDLFHSQKIEPFILNDLVLASIEQRKSALDLFYKTYSSELVSTLPQCRCGTLKGEYNLGITCNICETKCVSHFSEDGESNVWIRTPQGVAKLINPYIFLLLSERFTKVSFDVIKYLTDTTYNPGTRVPSPILNELSNLGVQRGYNYFIENFDEVVEKLFSLKTFKKDGDHDLLTLIRQSKTFIFSDYIPVPNKALLIVEKNEVGTYIDPIILGAVDGISMITSLDVEPERYKSSVKQNRVSKALFKLIDFYVDYIKKQISKKEGILRKHVYATRVHFSFRTVITSIEGEHRHDDIYIPHFIAVGILRPHLINKMLKLGFDYNHALGYINSKARTYDVFLESLFNELLAEAPGGRGIVCLLNRNPSLAQGSIQKVFISKIKTDVTDNTISLSVLCLPAFAGDLDGDALNGALVLDEYTSDQFEGLSHYNTLPSHTVPYGLSGTINMPKTVVANMNGFYNA